MSERRVSSMLARRTLAVMAVGVVGGVALIGLALAFFANGRLANAQATMLAELAPEFPPAACLTARQGWHRVLGPATEAWAYDGQTLRSAVPGAPELPASVRTALEGGARSAVDTSLPNLVGGTLAARISPAGPCGVIAVRWSQPHRLDRVVVLSLLLALGAVGSAAFGFAWVVRPLLARLGRVAGLAAKVGTNLSEEPVDPIEDEVTAIDRALRKADAQLVADRRALEEKTVALERFLRELGHDLKTPLASLKLSVDELLSAPSAEAGRSAMAELLYVEQLVENLRLEARLHQGGLTVQPTRFDLREVVDRTVAGLLPLARRAGVALEAGVPEEPVWLSTDRSLVERAVANLTHNAVTHGARHVGLTLQPLAAGFRLSIADDGPGLSATPSARRGEGLGVSIAGRALELTGLRLTYERGPDGGGTTALVTVQGAHD